MLADFDFDLLQKGQSTHWMDHAVYAPAGFELTEGYGVESPCYFESLLAPLIAGLASFSWDSECSITEDFNAKVWKYFGQVHPNTGVASPLLVSDNSHTALVRHFHKSLI